MLLAFASNSSPTRLAAAYRKCGVAIVAVATALATSPAIANPAPNAANFSQTTAGAISTTVPDGTCAAVTSTRGGAGASSGTTAALGGIGAAGLFFQHRMRHALK